MLSASRIAKSAVVACLGLSASIGALAATDTYDENFSSLAGNLIGTTNYGGSNQLPGAATGNLSWNWSETGGTVTVLSAIVGGNQLVFNGSADQMTFSFSLAPLAPGGSYDVSFSFLGRSLAGLAQGTLSTDLGPVTSPFSVASVLAGGTNVSYSFSGVAAGNYSIVLGHQAFAYSLDDFSISTTAVTPVPEPQALALAVAGLGVLGAMARRRRQA